MTKVYYNTYWKNQDELSDLPYKWPAIKDLFPAGKKRFLDFGCGTATLTKRVKYIRPDYVIYGTDVSDKALSKAKKRIPKGIFRPIGESQRIPFASRYFDVVLAADVLEHIYDTQTAFAELARVLKPGGILIISVPYNGKLKMILAVLFGFEFYFDPMSPHIRHFSPKTISRCVADAGLTVQKTGYFGRFYPLSRGMFLVASGPLAANKQK